MKESATYITMRTAQVYGLRRMCNVRARRTQNCSSGPAGSFRGVWALRRRIVWQTIGADTLALLSC